MRQVRVVAAILACVVAPGGATEPVPLRVCMLADNPPYSEQSGPAGFDLDVAAAVAVALDRPLAPVWIANARRVLELEESDLPVDQLARGTCDAVFSMPGPASDSLRGMPALALGAPYYGAAFELFGCAGAPPDLPGLAGRKVAIQAATVAHFAALHLRLIPVSYHSPEQALAGMRAGEAEAALLWGPTAGALLAADAGAATCAIAPDYVAPPALRWNLHVATRTEDAALRTALDQALAGLRADGRLAALSARHGLPLHAPFAETYTAAALRALGAAD